MKRVISLLTSALVLLLMVVPAMAADANFVTTIDASADTVVVGDSVTYTVSVSGEDCTAQKLAGVTITYDKAYFELVSGEFLQDKQDDKDNLIRSTFDLTKGNGAVAFREAHDFSGQVWKIVLKAIAESAKPQTVTISVRFGTYSAAIGPVEASVTTTVNPAPCEHEWGEGVVTTNPTCTADGVRTYTCSKCQDTKTEPISALGHDTTKTDAVAATCDASGNTEYYTCSRCGKYFSDAKGTQEIAEDSWIIDPTGEHNWSKWTSADTDNHTHTCSVCGKSETVAHEWDNGKVTTEPTCTEAGVKAYTCEKCGATKTENLVASGHNLKETPAIAATCGAAGNTEYYTCSRCGKYFSDAKGTQVIAKDSWIIDPTGEHNWSKWTSADTDNHTRTCSVCGKSETVAHEWDNGKVTTEPTCTEKGEKTLVCSVCNDTKTAEIDALGHNEETVEVTKAATCTVDGETVYKCSRCGEVQRTEVVKAAGHNFSTEWTVDVEATVGKAGSKSHHCLNCDERTDITEIPALTDDTPTPKPDTPKTGENNVWYLCVIVLVVVSGAAVTLTVLRKKAR